MRMRTFQPSYLITITPQGAILDLRHLRDRALVPRREEDQGSSDSAGGSNFRGNNLDRPECTQLTLNLGSAGEVSACKEAETSGTQRLAR